MPDSALSDHPVTQLTKALIACDSTNPDLTPGGAGEGAVSELIADRLRAAGMEVELVEVRPGRSLAWRGFGDGRLLPLAPAGNPAGLAGPVRSTGIQNQPGPSPGTSRGWSRR